MENQDIEQLISDVKTVLGDDCNITDESIKLYVNTYAKIVCTETCYKELPTEFIPYVLSATVESCQRQGNEGMASRSELSVSTSYSYKDIEESIRNKVRGKRNPRAFLGYWS
jgi:hypothetical protein